MDKAKKPASNRNNHHPDQSPPDQPPEPTSEKTGSEPTPRISLPNSTPDARDNVNISRIDPKIILVKIRGVTPLVVNAWSNKARDMIRGTQTKTRTKGAREAKIPEEDFNASRYIAWNLLTNSPAGWDGVPSGGVKGCLVNACRVVDNFPMTEAKRMVFVAGQGNTREGMSLVKIEGEPSIYEAMVRVGNGVADLRYRAMYTNWSMTLEIHYLANCISATQVTNLVELAGFVEGLCEHRPGSPKNHTGDFGRFVIEASA